MVRRRMWFRTRVAIARNLVASGSRAVPPPTPTSADLAAAGPAAAAIAEPENGDEVGRPGAVVRFSRGTVYNRELDNRRWRASAASRAAPHWTKQYFWDCAACEISPARAVAVRSLSAGPRRADPRAGSLVNQRARVWLDVVVPPPPQDSPQLRLCLPWRLPLPRACVRVVVVKERWGGLCSCTIRSPWTQTHSI
jgi:hypothetical protein